MKIREDLVQEYYTLNFGSYSVCSHHNLETMSGGLFYKLSYSYSCQRTICFVSTCKYLN